MSKILVIGESPVITSGFANVLRVLNQYFLDEGHEVEQIGWCLTTKTDIYPYKIHPTKFPYGSAFGADIFDDIVLNYKPDIVFSLGDIYMIDWIPRTRTRNTFHWIGYFPIDSIPIPQSWLDTIRNMDTVITYSNFAEEAILKQIPEVEHKLHMIYHGIDTKQFYPIDKKELRKEVGLPEDHFILTFVGTNSKRKEIPRLVEAFNIFAKNKDDVLLYMHTSLQTNAGKEGWFLKEILVQFPDILQNKLLVSKRAGAIGGTSLENVRKAYNIADVFVSASSCEGFGLGFIEAGACKVPTIAVDYSSMPELIKDRGILVAPIAWEMHCPLAQLRPLVDVKKMASAMNRLYRNRKLLDEYSQNAYDFAQTMTWDKFLPKFGNILNDLETINISKELNSSLSTVVI